MSSSPQLFFFFSFPRALMFMPSPYFYSIIHQHVVILHVMVNYNNTRINMFCLKGVAASSPRVPPIIGETVNFRAHFGAYH